MNSIMITWKIYLVTNVVAAISLNEYRNVLLNKNCLRHSLNRIQCKNRRLRTYEINKISLSCIDDKIFIQNNGCDRLAYLLLELIRKTSILITIKKQLSWYSLKKLFLSSNLF